MKLFFATLFILAGASVGAAQVASGGSYTLNKSVIAGGGGASSDQTGALYTVNGTAGQSAAGAVASGGTYSLQSGFHTAAAMTTTAAGASISGRVLTANGRGIVNARIIVTDNNGQTRVVTTGLRGTYRIEGVPSGGTFIVQVAAKRFTFAEPVQVLSISGDTTDTNFVAQP